MARHRFHFEGNFGGDDCDEEFLHWVLDQGGRGAKVLDIDMTGEVVAVDILK